MSNLNTSSGGFTIIELLVVAPIVLLTIGAFITAIVSMTGDVMAARGSNAMTYDIQDALSRIEDDVKLSTGFLEANRVTLTSPQGLDDGTAKFANAFVNPDLTTGSTLILNSQATTTNPSLAAGLVYLTGQPNACIVPQIYQNSPMILNVVYFVKGTTLFRRTISPVDYLTTGCAVPWQQPSCTTTGGFCKVQDIKLVEGVKAGDFVVKYYNDSFTTTANITASDPTATASNRNASLRSTTTIGVTIKATNTIAGRDITQTGSIRSTKIVAN